MIVEFDAEVWVWDARQTETWTFVSLPGDESDAIRDLTAGQRRGFGAVRVRAGIGTSTWATSIFPDSRRGVYVLPVKKAVRAKEKLGVGDVASVRVELIGY